MLKIGNDFFPTIFVPHIKLLSIVPVSLSHSPTRINCCRCFSYVNCAQMNLGGEIFLFLLHLMRLTPRFRLIAMTLRKFLKKKKKYFVCSFNLFHELSWLQMSERHIV